MHSFIHSFVHSFIHSCIHAFMHSCIHAFMHSCIHAFMHSCIHAFMHACMHSFIHSLIHSFIHSLIHSFIHSCIYAFMPEKYFCLKNIFLYWLDAACATRSSTKFHEVNVPDRTKPQLALPRSARKVSKAWPKSGLVSPRHQFNTLKM